MTNYEKICAYINAGHYAVCEDGDFLYIASSINDVHEVAYGRGSTINTTMECLGDYRADRSRFNDKKFTRIYPLPRPIPKYKVGDKVVILENIKEFEVGRHFTAGEVCIVMNSKLDDGTLCIGKVDSTSSWRVLPHCVAPYFDDEVEEMTVEQICKALGKNIKIVE